MSSLQGKRVLVTGADGFIGSHLVEHLESRGADVTALCVYNSNGSYGFLDPIAHSTDVNLVLGDIRDSGFVIDLCDGVDIVFHLAALIAIPFSYVAPRTYVETNVLGTLNVLEAVRRNDVSKMINTSTSEVYGTPDSVPIDESHTLKGQSPYSASKIAADKLCESFALSFECPVTVLRPFNTYGPRQSRRAVIPTILAQMLAGSEEIFLGSLTPQRDFTFVDDTVEGFIKMAEADLAPGEIIQLGTGSTISIGDLFDTCASVTGSTAVVKTDQERIRPAGSEVDILLSDPSKARDLIGWTPQVALSDGLDQVAQWLAANPSGNPGSYQR